MHKNIYRKKKSTTILQESKSIVNAVKEQQHSNVVRNPTKKAPHGSGDTSTASQSWYLQPSALPELHEEMVSQMTADLMGAVVIYCTSISLYIYVFTNI